MKGFSRALLAFFDAGKRDLPWRREPSAYRTLVSELMLQQTVVATVIPYFHRFLARFPTLAALAAADEGDVLALWSGLGYYSRARNLHRAARVVVERHGGELPPDEVALRALPGVGPYTAAAIAAIAFGIRTFPLDGNGARVFARVFDEHEAIDRPSVRERLRAQAGAIVPADRPGDFAQAVMDLGATICTPTSPRCVDCPVRANCGARKAGTEGSLPVRLQKAAKRVVDVACAAIERDGQVLLVRRPAGTLLGGTFTLPAAPGQDATAAAQAAQDVGLEVVGTPVRLGAIRHIFTHRDVTATVFRVVARGEGPPAGRWLRPDEHDRIALSSFTRKTLALLGGAAATAGATTSAATKAARRGQRKARMLSPLTT
jgi:A/G-specific adenine glycosylase